MTDASSFDETLMAAKAGEPWACTHLYDALKRPVASYVRLRGAGDPDDVTSEVFLQVFRDLDRFEGDEGSFRSWVFTVAHCRVLDDRRRRSRRVQEAPLPAEVDRAGGDVEEDVLASDSAARVASMLEVLTPEQREVMLLRIVADLSLDDVARITGRSVGAVKALQHRATVALRQVLVPDPVTPTALVAITEVT